MVRIVALRAIAQRFSFALLLVLAIALMMLGRMNADLVHGVRAQAMDAIAPVMAAMARPAATVADVIDHLQHLNDLREENARLRAENAALLQYQRAAYRLEAENLSLRTLMNYQPTTAYSYITARIIGDNSGAFVRSLTIGLGTDHGVRDGQAVMGGTGLVGRIVQAGDQSARVLLLSDLNAHIPVMLQDSRYRAILAGDNTDRPRLMYLPRGASVEIGDRIVTSGHGGMFPAGLPVGVVASIEDGMARVQPYEDFSRIEYVRIIDFHDADEGVAMRVAPGYAE